MFDVFIGIKEHKNSVTAVMAVHLAHSTDISATKLLIYNGDDMEGVINEFVSYFHLSMDSTSPATIYYLEEDEHNVRKGFLEHLGFVLSKASKQSRKHVKNCKRCKKMAGFKMLSSAKSKNGN